MVHVSLGGVPNGKVVDDQRKLDVTSGTYLGMADNCVGPGIVGVEYWQVCWLVAAHTCCI